MTTFDKNSIKFDKANNPTPPDRSDQTKVYYDGKELKKIDFNGQVSPLVPQQELKVSQVEVNTEEDATEFVLRIPSPNAKLKQLEETLTTLISSNKEEALSNFEEAIAIIKSYSDSQNLANGIFATEINDIEVALSELQQLVDTKASSAEVDSRINNISTELITIITNINYSLESKASKVYVNSLIEQLRNEIPAEISVEAGEITLDAAEAGLSVRRVGNTYVIDVSFPKGAIEQAVTQVASQVPGVRQLSKLKDVVLTNLQDNQILVYDAATGSWKNENNSGGSGFTPIAGDGIEIVPNGENYEFNVLDYISSTEVASISGDLQAQIDSIVIPDVSNFITTTEVASVSAGLDSRITTIENDYLVANDLTPYTLLTTTSSISADLQSQIDSIVQEGTSIASSGGSILVTQDGLTFNLEVASAPIQNHNELNGIDGGTFHLSEAQFNDFIGSTEVSSISGDLQTQIDSIVIPDVSNFITTSEVASISGDLQTQIDSIVIPDVSNFITTSEVASISGDLQGQIDSIVIPDVSNFITDSEVASISASLDGRITILESNPIPDIFRSEVQSISADLQTQIDNITFGAANYQLPFTNGDLVSNVLTVTHNLNQKYVSVTVFDNLDTQIIADDITLIDTNSLQVDLTSYGVITGTWTALVINGSYGSTTGGISGVPAEVQQINQTLTYDINGNLDTITTALGTRTFGYDGSGNLVTITGTGDYVSKTFGYDGSGNLITVTVS